ncbi:MAG: S-layer homology domain-containing protein [Clostridia bacterium]|nr:S-layer homology domain-containing protein [Clostridia bacterium]
MKRRIFVMLGFVLMLINTAVGASADIKAVEEATAKSIYENTQNPSISSVGGEWAVLGLVRSGYDIPEEYYDRYYENVKSYVNDCGGILHDKKYTEYSRVIITLTAIGRNPSDVDGYNLITPLGDYEKTVWQGLNGPVWALVALNCGNYEMPENSSAEIKATKDKYVDKILKSQLENGGWSMSEEGDAEVDITAMALIALSDYRERENVASAIDSALSYLSRVQNENGGFVNSGDENAESCAQVITALCEIGISADDERFVKNGNTLSDNLLSFYDGKGGFKHTHNEEISSPMATEQALYALAAVNRFSEGLPSLFDMSDVKKRKQETGNTVGLPLKDEAVKERPIQYPGRTFSDIENCSEGQKIEALAERGIVNGKSEDSFEPDSTMTRAEFTAIIVKSLGFDVVGEEIFKDVLPNDWYFGFVSTAFKKGMVKGVNADEFNPGGKITREEAAVMLQRAAYLCGIENTYDENSVRDIISIYTDYIRISQWARESIAFCRDNGIWVYDDIEVLPKEAVTRAEMASMLYNMLCSAQLIEKNL